MRFFFGFSVKERNGILTMILTICLLQAGIFFFGTQPAESLELSEHHLAMLKEIDSLKQLQQQSKTFRINPFNPNFISDFKGYTLGMTSDQIDRLHKFRSSGNWINSTAQFQQVTGVPDSLLNQISPLFKFPEWVSTSKRRETDFKIKSNRILSYSEKLDLNTASIEDLKTVFGIGDALSGRIIRYRGKFEGGFVSDVELNFIYGLSAEVIERIKEKFTVKTPRPIARFNLNTASQEDLVKIPFIDYELAFEIIQQRMLLEGFNSLDELTKVKDFPSDKIDLIKLYLSLE